ncbi:MAG: hypothetical protein AB7U45_10310 [Desulfamplus sp.]
MTGIVPVVWNTVCFPIAVILITIKRRTNLLTWKWSEAFPIIRLSLIKIPIKRFVKWTWGEQL